MFFSTIFLNQQACVTFLKVQHSQIYSSITNLRNTFVLHKLCSKIAQALELYAYFERYKKGKWMNMEVIFISVLLIKQYYFAYYQLIISWRWRLSSYQALFVNLEIFCFRQFWKKVDCFFQKTVIISNCKPANTSIWFTK